MERLGTWALPSGNSCDVEFDPGSRELVMSWDTPPSAGWPAEDLASYRDSVRPDIVARLTKRFGGGPALVLEPGGRN